MIKLLLGLCLGLSAMADTPITKLPLQNAASIGSTDSFPFVSVANSSTMRLPLSSILSIPSLQSPTFTGTVTAGAFVGNLTGTSTNVTGTVAVGNGGTGLNAGGAQYQTFVMGASSPAWGQVNLGQSAAITGTLPVGNGGTGVANLTAYGLVGAGTTSTGAFQSAGTGTSGQVYVSAGSAALGTWTSGYLAANQQKPTVQQLSNGTTTYYLTYVFTVTSANATAAATYTNNSKTCTVEATIASATTLYAYCTGDPLTTFPITLTKSGGTGDSTITASAWIKPVRLRIIGVAGGGGGSGSGTGTSSTSAGANGGNTTFGSILTATGGGKGTSWSTQAVSAGGACTTGDWGVAGGSGGPPRMNTTSLTTVDGMVGGVGGSTPYGQGAPSAENQGGGSQACTGYGSGGGVPGLLNGTNNTNGGSPGAGGGTCYVDVLASTLSFPVTVAIGAGSSGASAGTGGAGGGPGCNGVLIITEYYNY